MKFKIEHAIQGRIRIHLFQKTMTAEQADTLQYYLTNLDFVTSAKVYERTRDVAIRDGAAIAREISDITIGGDNLYGIVTLKQISNLLMKRIDWNYRNIVGINGTMIGLGVAGIVQPTTSALVHNASTLAISLNSMKNLLP